MRVAAGLCLFFTVLLPSALDAGALAGGGRAASQATAARPRDYACPMHPDVRGEEGQACPRCGMLLVKSRAGDSDAKVVEVTAIPRAVKPRRPATLDVTIRDPESLAPVRELELVHEQRLHVFVVSQDLSYFAHLHPTEAAGDALRIPVTLPEEGLYRLYFDFLPRGGTPQLVQRSLMTAGYRGGVGHGSIARDLSDKVAGGVRVALQLPVDGLVAGREQQFRFGLADAMSGRPTTDLEPFLGASGHLFVLSEDLEHAAHSHPVPDFSDAGGPNVVFGALFPRPGRYRLWAQFQRGGHVLVAAFTVSVMPG